MGHRDPTGAWTFYDVFAGAGYNHGNVSFYDIQVGYVDGEIAVYYGKNSYTGSSTAQSAPGLFRKIWDPTTSTFGPEVSLTLANQNGTFGLLCTPETELVGLREFFVYRDNTTDVDIYAYRDPTGLLVRTVSSSLTTVAEGQTGADVSVTVENLGGNLLDTLAATLSFTDPGLVDVSSEYVVTPDPGNPTTIAGGSTETLDFSVDVLAGVTQGLITVDAAGSANDSVTGNPITDPGADTPLVWDVVGCLAPNCGDCNGDTQISILDALVAAQHSAGLTILTGSDFSNCNVTGLLEPDPSATVDILDALTLAQYAAGVVGSLTCC
jgi:hypothetical protein